MPKHKSMPPTSGITALLTLAAALFAGTVLQGCGDRSTTIIGRVIKERVGKTIADLCAASAEQTFGKMRAELVEQTQVFCMKEDAYEIYLKKLYLAEEHQAAATVAKGIWENISREADRLAKSNDTRSLALPPNDTCVEMQTAKVDEVIAREQKNITKGCRQLYANMTLLDFLQADMDEHVQNMTTLNEGFMDELRKSIHIRVATPEEMNGTGNSTMNATNATINWSINSTSNVPEEIVEQDPLNKFNWVDVPGATPADKLAWIDGQLKKLANNSATEALDQRPQP